MKMQYVSPAIEIICFASREQMARDIEIDFDQILGSSGLYDSTVSTQGDVIVPIPTTGT